MKNEYGMKQKEAVVMYLKILSLYSSEKNTTKKLNYDSRYPEQHLNRVSLERKSEQLLSTLTCSVNAKK
jgi:hypothetical protein